ncbi:MULTISPECIES: 50S ribosomal protein P1 [Pyrobaculum]|uniref:Large ribosomal subunit protein P1 n=3 Tax=Pyrobaculum TaxID=2276 RepID=A4WJ03_PYRAR|nr:50S ribosomal protein P1 [Pyrobaculum arsenaticum]ABP50370.1 LSU ribosomal protein L12AE [Pyrobaculum arsenaticum DSM 13514]AFA39576.1 50S ribosomal protein L12P [Pyrobaculum oguniense TE7]MCY0890358.1 50S ribosomal protein P1 [Pyrobaculum arsenaticum]NYR14685.1 50S ribosomal protein P1 [Pyrobaculum arsenaticum]
MEYIYGALLLHYAKQEINEENLAKVLQAAGISPDEVRIKTLVAALKEVNIEEAIKSAAFAPVAAAPVAAPAAAASTAAAAQAPAAEKKEEEEKKGPSEEEIAGSLASLF